jgi:hypothetical protein
MAASSTARRAGKRRTGYSGEHRLKTMLFLHVDHKLPDEMRTFRSGAGTRFILTQTAYPAR